MEEPFEWISEFRYHFQEQGSPSVWWRYPREYRLPEPPEALGVAPEKILLLYQEE